MATSPTLDYQEKYAALSFAITLATEKVHDESLSPKAVDMIQYLLDTLELMREDLVKEEKKSKIILPGLF